jgi:hypothetical protein
VRTWVVKVYSQLTDCYSLSQNYDIPTSKLVKSLPTMLWATKNFISIVNWIFRLDLKLEGARVIQSEEETDLRRQICKLVTEQNQLVLSNGKVLCHLQLLILFFPVHTSLRFSHEFLPAGPGGPYRMIIFCDSQTQHRCHVQLTLYRTKVLLALSFRQRGPHENFWEGFAQ